MSDFHDLLQFSLDNFEENQLAKEESQLKSRELLKKFLDNERKGGKKYAKQVNFKKFEVRELSISKSIYSKQKVNDGRVVEELAGKQRSVNLSRIANSLQINLQDLNFLQKEAIDSNRLRELTGKTNNIDWIEIAKQYGTKHTPIQLYKHYKTEINPNVKRMEFNEEEEKLLKRGIELYGNNSAAITTVLPGRDLTQIHAKRKYFMKKVGKWDKDEDAMLMKGIELHSYRDNNITESNINWVLVSEFMETRTGEQCRNRYTTKLNPSLDHSKLSSDEKAKVLELVKELGVGKLKEVASHFPTRSPQVITNCYKVYSRKNESVAKSGKRKRND